MTAIALYVLDTKDEAVLPPSGYLSMVCQEFGIDPDRALELDPRMVKEIIEYRIAISAKDQFKKNASEMSKSQRLIWEEIVLIAQDRGVRRSGNNS